MKSTMRQKSPERDQFPAPLYVRHSGTRNFPRILPYSINSTLFLNNNDVPLWLDSSTIPLSK